MSLIRPDQARRALEIIQRIARERGAGGIAAEAAEAQSALESGGFHVAVLGQFKRGKSTLINALLGRRVLPVDVVPLTSAITVLRHGGEERCMVHYESGKVETAPLAALGQFVSEEGNPGNRKGVRAVFVEIAHDFLKNGLRLVDTPGVGSVFELNSETTRAFLPRIDIAMVVLGCDPPVTGEELHLIRAMAPLTEHILVVLNKADLVPPEGLAKADAFTRTVLRDVLGGDPGPLAACSALRALDGPGDGGVPPLASRLSALAASGGAGLAARSATRAGSHLARRLLQDIALERGALIEPLTVLDSRISRFQASMHDIEDAMLAAGIRVQHEFHLRGQAWTERREAFIRERMRSILPALQAEASAANPGRARLRDWVRERALHHTLTTLEEWRATARDHFEGYYSRRAGLAESEMNRIAGRVAEAAAEAFKIQRQPFDLPALPSLTPPSPADFPEPVAALDPQEWLFPLITHLLPRAWLLPRVLGHERPHLERALMRLLYKVDEGYILWLDGATRRLTEAMKERLDGLQREILDALAHGRREREEGAAAVAKRLSLLERQDAALRTWAP